MWALYYSSILAFKMAPPFYSVTLGVGASLEAMVPGHPQTGPLDPVHTFVPLAKCPLGTSCEWVCCLPVADCTRLPSPPLPPCPALLLSEARTINLDGIPYLLGCCCTVFLPLTEGRCKQRLCFMTSHVPGVGTVCTRHRCLPDDT